MFKRTMYMMSLAVLPCLALLSGCSHAKPAWPDKPGKKILATFTPIYCFTEAIAGDDANVLCLLTADDPHNKEATIPDVLKVRNADLIVANGLLLEDGMLSKLIASAGKKNLMVLKAGDALGEKMLLHSDDDHDHDHGHHHHGKDHKHSHGDHDPHVWLGPDRAKKMVDVIANKLGELEPSKKENFDKRAKEFKDKLDELKKNGLAKLGGKKIKIITQHGSLGYFANEFGLEIVGSIRSVSDQEQGVNKELIDRSKKERPSLIVAEVGRDDRDVKAMQNTLKKEGVETTIVSDFDPLEKFQGTGSPSASYYLERMQQNIDKLAQALK